MKFTAVTVACLATGVVADIATIKSAIDAVGKELGNVDEAVKSFSGSPQPVQEAAKKLVSTIQESKSKVSGTQKLTLVEAVGLQSPVEGLTSKSKTLADDLKTRKPEIEKGGYCSLVRGPASDIESNSLELINAVTSKVPDEAKTIAEGLSSELKKILADVKSQFSEENCKGSAPKSSAPASSAPASSAPASSEPASEPASSAPAETSAPASSGYPVPSQSESEPATSAETSAPASSGYPVPSQSASEPATTPYQPTGTGVPTGYPTGQPPMVTAGAALVAPAGALAMAVAAMML